MALIETLTDDFASGAGWSPYGSTSFDGQAHVDANSGSGFYKNPFAGYDLTGSHCHIEFVTAAGTLTFPLYLQDSSDANHLEFAYDGTNIFAAKKVGGAGSGVALSGSTVAYNSTAHRWFRFREASGTVYWEVAASASGPWTSIHSEAAPFAVTSLAPAVYASGSGGTAVWDNLNLGAGGGGGSPPAFTTDPSITGTSGVGATYTGHIGVATNTPTLYAYEFRWLMQGTGTSYPPNSGYQTIPGTAGTTTNPATTPTYTQAKSDASRNIVFHVTASNAAGAASKDSAARIFYNDKIPFKAAGNPFLTPISAPVYNAELTSVFQTAISDYRTVWGTDWWLQGGNYGDAYSVYLHRVDSSMTRTPFLLAGPGGFGSHDLRNPKTAQVQNGAIDTHLAWSIGVKNGGIPTPPGGFRIPDGSDAHLLVYVEDTFELFELWATYFVSPGGSLGGTPYSHDYDNRWVCFWGGYMRDVRDNPGTWFGDGFGTGRYRTDADGNLEYAGWGGAATSISLASVMMLEKELVVDAEIEHGVGFIMPGHLSTFAFPAQREASSEPGGTVGQGGVITIDPSLSIPGLATLGDATADGFRAKVLKAIQKYCSTNFDSTGNIIALKQEAIGGTWPTIPNVASQGSASMNQIMDSVPISAWRIMSPSWRPAGSPLNAKTAAVVEGWTSFDTGKWSSGSGVSAAGGQLTLSSSGSNTAVWPYDWAKRSLVGSSVQFQTITMPAGATKNTCGLQPLNQEWNSPGVRFNIIGGNLRCELFDWYGTKVGSDTVVAFNATTHKYLRLRMNADHSVDWQTSPGGAGPTSGWTWTTQRTATPTIDLEQANITFELIGPATTTAVWGPLNAGVVPPDTTPPAAPTGLVVIAATDSTVTLDWLDNAESDLNAVPYLIERAPHGGSFAQVGTSAASAFADTSVAASTQYDYRVKARDNASTPNVSGGSNIVTVTTAATPVESDVAVFALDALDRLAPVNR